jgi:hypothetical protein
MDRDTITRTGARASGVEGQDPSNGGAQPSLLFGHSAGRKVWPRSARRVDANFLLRRVCLVLA